MAINFPTSLDTITNPNTTDALNSPSHAGQHSTANDILEALEAKVGADGSIVTTSHDYKIAQLETGKVATNTAITGATKTKITYDAKGLVTAGEDATTADIAESTNKKYITDAEETAIGTIGDKIDKSLVDAKGDIITATADNTPARLALGNNGEVLTVDTTTATGLKYAVPSAGGNPTGTILLWATATAPTGYLLADGAVVSRTTYAGLFGVIGTTYGVGDGSTTFGLPNLKGRIPVGLNSAETEFDALGETGGAKTHTLITDEIPSHTHGLRGAGGGVASISNGGNGTTTTWTSTATGGGLAHNNLQPYIVINYIIKT